MKRIIVTAIACGVWLSGVTSAGALTYVLDRSPTPPTNGMASPSQALRGVDDQDKTVVEFAATVVRPPARPHAHHALPVTLPPPSPRDIDEMTCAGWRELDMGSGHVQICE